MTQTQPSVKSPRSGSKRPGRANSNSGVGLQPHKRTGIDIAIALLTPIVGQEFLDKYHLRDPMNRALRYGVKTMFSTAAPPAVSSNGCRARVAGRPA